MHGRHNESFIDMTARLSGMKSNLRSTEMYDLQLNLKIRFHHSMSGEWCDYSKKLKGISSFFREIKAFLKSPQIDEISVKTQCFTIRFSLFSFELSFSYGEMAVKNDSPALPQKREINWPIWNRKRLHSTQR